MSNELLSLVSAAILFLGSPGPAPLALAAVGATVGFKKGLAFLIGVVLALVIVSIIAATSFYVLISINPLWLYIIQVLGAFYIVFIAYKIVNNALQNSNGDGAKVPTFVDGFLLNLLNPKAYAAFIVLLSQFALPAKSLSISLISSGAIALIVAAIVDILWLKFGQSLAGLLRHPKASKALSLSLAALMIVMLVVALSQ